MKNQKKAIEQKRVRLIAKGNFNRGIGMTVTSISLIEKIGGCKIVCVNWQKEQKEEAFQLCKL